MQYTCETLAILKGIPIRQFIIEKLTKMRNSYKNYTYLVDWGFVKTSGEHVNKLLHNDKLEKSQKKIQTHLTVLTLKLLPDGVKIVIDKESS